MRFPLLALLLVRDLCPEGMPDRFGGPRHERLSQDWDTGDASAPRLFSRGVQSLVRCRHIFAVPPLQETVRVAPRRQPRGGTQRQVLRGQGLKQEAIGMTLGVRCNGRIKSLDRVQGHAQLPAEGLDEQGMGGLTPSSVVKGVAGLMA
jgi:hypothetical protein